jgi:tryptophan halogenase
MTVPDSLSRKIELFHHSAVLQREQDDLFTELAWQQVLLGQRVLPQHYQPLADKLNPAQLSELLENLRLIVQGIVKPMPTHAETLARMTQRS